MGKRKPKEPAMGTSLGDLLFQKNVKCEDVAGPDAGVAELLREKNGLEERCGLLEEKCEALRQSNDSLREEVNRLDARVRELEEEKISFASTLFERAVGELRNGMFLQAHGLLQAVLVHEPGNVKATINLAVVYAELGFRDEAVETLAEVLARDPHNEVALKNLNILRDELKE